jgi:hypothetical protein
MTRRALPVLALALAAGLTALSARVCGLIAEPFQPSPSALSPDRVFWSAVRAAAELFSRSAPSWNPITRRSASGSGPLTSPPARPGHVGHAVPTQEPIEPSDGLPISDPAHSTAIESGKSTAAVDFPYCDKRVARSSSRVRKPCGQIDSESFAGLRLTVPTPLVASAAHSRRYFPTMSGLAQPR